MINNAYFGITQSNVISRLPINICQIEGIYNGAGNVFFQIWDYFKAPDGNAALVYQLPMFPNTQFFENLQTSHLVLNVGCFVGISSASGVWTPATGQPMDLNLFTDTEIITTSAQTALAGNQLTAWSSGTNPHNAKRLYAIHVYNTNTTQGGYLYISANSTDLTLNYPPGFVGIIKPGAASGPAGYTRFYFGGGSFAGNPSGQFFECQSPLGTLIYDCSIFAGDNTSGGILLGGALVGTSYSYNIFAITN
jgi:hypothetical protein